MEITPRLVTSASKQEMAGPKVLKPVHANSTNVTHFPIPPRFTLINTTTVTAAGRFTII